MLYTTITPTQAREITPTQAREELERRRREECFDEMLVALHKVSCTLTIEDHLRPEYGWRDWMEENILPVIAKAEGK